MCLEYRSEQRVHEQAVDPLSFSSLVQATDTASFGLLRSVVCRVYLLLLLCCRDASEEGEKERSREIDIQPL